VRKCALLQGKNISGITDHGDVVRQEVARAASGEPFRDIDAVSDAAGLQMEVNELRGSGVTHEAHDVPFLERATGRKARRDRIQMAMKKDVVAKLAPLMDRVPGHDGRAEERPGVEDVPVAFLVLQRHDRDRRSALLRQVDSAVPDRAERSPTSLLSVGPVEVVPAHHVVASGQSRRDGVLVAVIVFRAIGAAWDLGIRGPCPAPHPVRVGAFELLGRPFVVAGQVYAHVSIGQRSHRAAEVLVPIGVRARRGLEDRHALRRQRSGRGAERDDARGEEGRGDDAHRRSSVTVQHACRARPSPCGRQRPVTKPNLDPLFDAEREVRRNHVELLRGDRAALVPALREAATSALAKVESEPDEAILRLVRISALLAESEGEVAVDTLIDILGSDAPEARHHAGEALEDLAFDRFKEVALGIERALTRLPAGSPALSELPYLLAEVGEPGCLKLLGRFLQHPDADAVAAAVEALVELGDPTAAHLLAPLEKDTRQVQLSEDDGERIAIGDLAMEARQLLGELEPARPKKGGR
jgi:hypothetical protein